MSFTISQVCSNSYPLSRWCYPTFSSSVIPFSSCLQSLQHQSLVQWVGSTYWVAKVLELQHQSFQWISRIDFLYDWLVWSPCCPKTLKSLLQHHNLKAAILRCSAFFVVLLSHLYMTTGKNRALTWQIFVSKMMSLLFNMLSRFVIAFLPRSKCLLISWLLSLSSVILEPKKIKSVTSSTFSPSVCHEWWDQMLWY